MFDALIKLVPFVKKTEHVFDISLYNNVLNN